VPNIKMQISTAAVLIGAAMTSAVNATTVIPVTLSLTKTRLAAFDNSEFGYVGRITHVQNPGAANLIAIRPNGEQSWQSSSPFGGLAQSVGTVNSLLSSASIDSWSASNFTGVWQYGQNGVANQTFDTTSTMSNWASNTGVFQQRFVGLTASSAAQFESIRSQGLTGTFTFELDAPVTQWNSTTVISGLPNPQIFVDYSANITNGMNAPYQILNINGSSFSVSITSALASNSMLKISQVIKYEWISLEYNQKVVVLNDTMYGAPIPAPGAIALLGLAGLARGRRRR
jgi:hypothetical protein